MSKTKIKMVIMGTITALLLTGVAYAAWSDEIVVEAMAASGELNIDITSSRVNSASDYVVFDDSNIVVAENKKSASVSIGNNYPGSQVKYTITITNVGSLPVKLTEIIHNKKNVTDTKTGDDHGRNSDMFSCINTEYYIDVYDAEGTKLDSSAIINTESSSGWVESYYVDNELPELEPGDYIMLHTRVYFSEDATETIENKAFSFSVTPVFTQFS